MEYERDTITPKIHPTQKSIHVLKNIIEIFTDPGDVVIDPVAGSGTTLVAAKMLGRRAYGFEIKKNFVKDFNEVMRPLVAPIETVNNGVMPNLFYGGVI